MLPEAPDGPVTNGERTCGPDALVLHLTHDEQAARTARRAVGALLLERGLPADTGELLVSELVAHAVGHAVSRCDVVLRADVAGRSLRVEVDDGCERLPREGGRGLLLVDTLADRWGVQPVDGATRLWCELDLPD